MNLYTRIKQAVIGILDTFITKNHFHILYFCFSFHLLRDFLLVNKTFIYKKNDS